MEYNSTLYSVLQKMTEITPEQKDEFRDWVRKQMNNDSYCHDCNGKLFAHWRMVYLNTYRNEHNDFLNNKNQVKEFIFEDIKDMTLKELRELFPDIKANSKKNFLEQLK